MASNYVSKNIALQKIGVSHMTLLKMAENNKIEVIKTPGGHRKYNVEKYINDNKNSIDNEIKVPTNTTIEMSNKLNICYVRISNDNYMDDLSKQKEYMNNKYPGYKIIEDVGLSIDFNRKGLKTIINFAIAGVVGNLVVLTKDSLTLFGFDMIESLIKDYSQGSIIIDNGKTRKGDLIEDVLSVMNICTDKMSTMRKPIKNKK